MESLADKAIERTHSSQLTYCKFVTPNEVGLTGGHQTGFLVGKGSYKILFDTPGNKGSNKERTGITIKWQDDFETSESRFVYYGVGTRNEYRITRFGRNFGLLTKDSLGSLFVLCKQHDDYYYAYILTSDDDIEDYLASFNLLPTETNRLINVRQKPAITDMVASFLASLDREFPTTEQVSSFAQARYLDSHNTWAQAVAQPDAAILELIDTEYTIFQQVENILYEDLLTSKFDSLDELITASKSILNRRKSRAGKSLENHLSKIFDLHDLKYSEQKKTEGNKRPDFIMPSIDAYHDPEFEFINLTFLGVKTTCKDRWRQVLNEADRIPHKHLFTLQPGISSNQIQEMEEEGLTLVIPQQNIAYFDSRDRHKLMSLETFIASTKDKQRAVSD